MIKQAIKNIFSAFGLEIRKKIHAPLNNSVAYNSKENVSLHNIIFMKMKTNSIGVIFFFIGVITLKAQSTSPDVIATSGDYYSSAGGSVSWTLGEIMGETYSSINNRLTQGFQQPKLLVTSVPTIQGELFGTLFPNPINTTVTVSVNVKSEFVIYDMLGQQIGKWDVTAGKNEINLSNLANGMYHAILINAATHSTQSFKIIKSE